MIVAFCPHCGADVAGAEEFVANASIDIGSKGHSYINRVEAELVITIVKAVIQSMDE